MLSRLAMARALTGSIQPNSPAVKVPLAFSAKLIGHDVGDQRGEDYQGYTPTRQMIIEIIIEGARGNIGRTLPELEEFDTLTGIASRNALFGLIVCRR